MHIIILNCLCIYDLGDDRNMHDGDDGNYGQCHDDQKKF